MIEKPPYPLYELSGEEFERLCVDLLVAADPHLSISSIEVPRWIDAVGTRTTNQGARSVAIETSHRTTFHPEGLRHFLERLSREDRKFDEYIFITSSPIQDIHRQLTNSIAEKALNAEVKILGQADLVSLLNSHSVVAAKYFEGVRNRVKQRKIAAILSSLVLAVSIGSLANALYSFLGPTNEPKSQLGEQVKSVEDSIKRLGDLERSLKALTIELQKKSDESARITKEYEEAMKLKSLTTEQLELINKAVGAQSRLDIFLNYLFGFLLGVASSVLATIITDKWKQWRALTKPYA